MKYLILTAFLTAWKFSSVAQVTFQKIYGDLGNDAGYAVQETTDGGYILAGASSGSVTLDTNAYLVKIDANGDMLWAKTYGAFGNDEFHAVQQMADGGYIAAGKTSPGGGNSEIFLVRTDQNGDTIWTKAFGGSGNDYANDIQKTSDGGFIITGTSNSFNGISNAVYLIKTDSLASVLWEKTYEAVSGNSVRQTADNGFIITGTCNSVNGGINVLLLKTDANGDSLWTKSYSKVSFSPDEGISVKQTLDGGYIIAGHSITLGAGAYDGYLIRTDQSGDTLWIKNYNANGIQQFYGVEQNPDGSFIVAGHTSMPAAATAAYLMKTDANGDTLWTRTFGTQNVKLVNSFQKTSDGGNIIIGQYMFPGFGWEIWLIKTDSSGNSCQQNQLPLTITTPPALFTSPGSIAGSPVSTASSPAIVVSSSGGANLSVCSNVGVNEMVNINPVIISPNPSDGRFNILFEKSLSSGRIDIMTTEGKIIIRENVSEISQKVMNLPGLSSGLYIVKVTSDRYNYSGKIIIQ